ncbi:RcnB family protein [Parasphingorhabdus cellanae]|uniref:RcnB family protein n=1 Tax=Parasphingorhabdus cellanae TaxID=2806553 RepID=UPI001FB12725|nr:RcnB family protein [Parasphingorhabdus cellanae]
MKILLFAGLTGAMAMLPAAASAAIESVPASVQAKAPLDISFASATALASTAQGAKKIMNRVGGKQIRHGVHAGRKFRDGAQVRMGRIGDRRGYQRPHRGFRLPRTFIQPRFFIANYGNYGLRQPSAGYGWSRYYNDAVLTDRRGVVYDSVNNLDWDRYNHGYNDGYRAGQATYDNSVFMNDDRVVATPKAYRGSTTYQGDWDGAYREDGSYRGDWKGTYRDADGAVYEGQYSGTFIGDGNAAQVGASYADGPHWSRSEGPVRAGHDYEAPRYEAERYDGRDEELAYLERCKKSSGIGGAVVGGAIGALAGNRIAGRGNRLGGSLIGGGVGALAGAAIDQSTDRCRKLLKKYGQDSRERQSYSRAQRPEYRVPVQQPHYRTQYVYPSGWQGGYYYPQAQPMVTTIVIQSAPVTTTTTTTYIDEEVIYTKAKPTKKRWKPAPKRAWKPKHVPAPVKGCQQECCLYCD